MQIYTIGHSTHSKEVFLKMLAKVSIGSLVDVRAFPGSNKFPQYSQDHMPSWLEKAGIDYHHIPNLGGRLGKWGAMPIIEKDGMVVYPEI